MAKETCAYRSRGIRAQHDGEAWQQAAGLVPGAESESSHPREGKLGVG